MNGIYVWVVYWTVVLVSPKLCPPPPLNPYTGEMIGISSSPALSCSDFTPKNMEREFETEYAAKDFVEHGPKSIHFDIVRRYRMSRGT